MFLSRGRCYRLHRHKLRLRLRHCYARSPPTITSDLSPSGTSGAIQTARQGARGHGLQYSTMTDSTKDAIGNETGSFSSFSSFLGTPVSLSASRSRQTVLGPGQRRIAITRDFWKCLPQALEALHSRFAGPLVVSSADTVRTSTFSTPGSGTKLSHSVSGSQATCIFLEKHGDNGTLAKYMAERLKQGVGAVSKDKPWFVAGRHGTLDVSTSVRATGHAFAPVN